MLHNNKKDPKKKRRIFGKSSQLEHEMTFDQQYRKKLSQSERVERIELVSTKLSQKYGKYEATATFVDYLRATDEIFARAQSENWTVEETEREMIQGEIVLMSDQSGIDEVIFHQIYDEFQKMNTSARRIQMVAKMLGEKYNSKGSVECVQFINYIKDYLLVFSEAISGDLTLDETRDKIIKMRMQVLAEKSETPVHILEKIYTEFITLLQKPH